MKKSEKKILVIAGGGVKHLEPFEKAAKKLHIDLTIASFSHLQYLTDDKGFKLTLNGDRDLNDFDVIYIRLVGKRFEDASLLASYAREKGAKIVDKIYEKARYTRLPIAKALEVKIFKEGGVPVPKTLFAKLNVIRKKGPEIFGYPFVIKGTFGKQGHAVWGPRDETELTEIVNKLTEREKKGERFLAQEFIKASQRERVLVIGGKAIAGITRPTRWRRRFIKKVNGEFPEGIRKGLFPVPKEDSEIAIAACGVLGIDVGGVDIIREDASGKPFVLEVNSAPRWEAIKKDTDVDVEKEIVKFLASL